MASSTAEHNSAWLAVEALLDSSNLGTLLNQAFNFVPNVQLAEVACARHLAKLKEAIPIIGLEAIAGWRMRHRQKRVLALVSPDSSRPCAQVKVWVGMQRAKHGLMS